MQLSPKAQASRKAGVSNTMDSISTTNLIANRIQFAGRNWFYDFSELRMVFAESSCANQASRLRERYSKLTKNWNAEKNSEWLCRLYMSAKLIMGTTLYVNSMYYAKDRNLRVVVPYLRYYSMLSLLRAIYFSLPEQQWQGGKLISRPHSTVINSVLSYMQQFDSGFGASLKDEINRIKAERELISYRAPSSGDAHLSWNYNFLSKCKLLAELAQFNSELFEASFAKHANPAEFNFLPEYWTKLSNVEIDGYDLDFGDPKDACRLDHLARKHPYPANIMHLMTHDHVDAFFGAWAPKDGAGDVFNPEEKMSIIFEIP
jgi:hypothetical protein